jgi:hypothetical protein
VPAVRQLHYSHVNFAIKPSRDRIRAFAASGVTIEKKDNARTSTL